MEINEKQLVISLEKTAIQEYCNRYEKEGYKVYKDHKFGNFIADLFVENNNEKIIFEFKYGGLKDRHCIASFRNYAKENNIKFRIVTIQIPKKREITVDGIDLYLENEFKSNVPKALNDLSSYTSIVEVLDTYITSIHLKENGKIEIEGKSTVLIDYRFYEEESNSSEDFQFTFKGIWAYSENGNLKFEEFKELNIDTSKFEK